MYGFRAFPRIGQRLVGRRAYITRNQRIHGFRRHLRSGLSCSRYLGHLSVEDALLVRIDFERCQHVDLLDQEQRGILLPQLLRHLSQQARRFRVLVRLPEQLYSLHLLVLLDQMVRVPLQQLLDLEEVVLLRELDRQVPLVQQHTAIDCLLRIPELDVGVHGILAQAHRLELFPQQFERR